MATEKPTRRYWDAFCFITILNNEADASTCLQVLEEAKTGRLEIVVSPLVQAEVVRPRGANSPVSLEKIEKVRDFFENDYLKWRNIDRVIGEKAQRLCMEHGLHPRDALHLACALESGCRFLETGDQKLLGLNSTALGITIRRPKCEGTLPLFV